MFNLTLSSYIGSTGKLILHTYCTSMLSIDSCQNRVSSEQYDMTVSRAQVSTHRGRAFFEVIRWQVTSFQMIAGSSLIFLSCKWNMFCYNYNLDFKLTSEAKIQPVFTGREDGCFWLFSLWSCVGHALQARWKTKTIPSEIGFPTLTSDASLSQKTISKLAVNNKRLLITPVFHFVHLVEKDS